MKNYLAVIFGFFVCCMAPTLEFCQQVEKPAKPINAKTMALHRKVLKPGELSADESARLQVSQAHVQVAAARADQFSAMADAWKARAAIFSGQHESNRQAICKAHDLEPEKCQVSKDFKTLISPGSAAAEPAPEPTAALPTANAK